MSLQNVLQGLHVIEKTSSSNDKIELLKPFMKDKNSLLVVKAALNETIHYNIQKLPPYQKDGGTSVEKIFKKLIELSKQPGVSDRDKKDLSFHASIDMATWEIVQRIVKKDLRIGANAKSVNKARPGTIRIMPYMRCSSEKKIDKIEYPCYSQEKADGMFDNVLVNDKKQIVFLTRNGKKVLQLKKLKSIIQKSAEKNSVYMGELLVMKDGEILDRKTGNGILNQCIQGTASQEDADCVVFRCWDYVPLADFWKGIWKTKYSVRLNKYVNQFVINADSPFVQIVETVVINNDKEGRDFYKLKRKEGKEGTIRKNFDGFWKDHTSPNQIKEKNVMDVELKLVSWYYGDKGKKYEKCLGGITVESSCGKLVTNCGSGFSDEDRGYFPDKGDGVDEKTREGLRNMALKKWDAAVGNIMQLEAESAIKDKRNNTYALFLPRFIEPRVDKSVADSLKEILDK